MSTIAIVLALGSIVAAIEDATATAVGLCIWALCVAIGNAIWGRRDT